MSASMLSRATRTAVFRMFAVLAFSGVSASACAHAPRNAPAAEAVLEIFNPQNQGMNVAFTLGGNTTQLGTVSARDTRRWAIPAENGARVRLVATDGAGKLSIVKELSLDRGQVVRWEIRQ